MALILASALVLGMVAAFVAPLYYCRESVKTEGDESTQGQRFIVENESCKSSGSPDVQIKIKRPRSVNVVSPRLLEATETKDLPGPDECSSSLGKDDDPPSSSDEDSGKPESLPSRSRDRTITTSSRITRARSPKEIQPSATHRRRFFENLLLWRKSQRAAQPVVPTNDGSILDSSGRSSISERTARGSTSVPSSKSGRCGSTKVVTAQIEIRPKHCTSSTIEPEESVEQNRTTSAVISSGEKSAPLTKILLGKLRTFKESLRPPVLGEEASFERISGESQRTNATSRSPVGHSTILSRRQPLEKRTNPLKRMFGTRESQRGSQNSLSQNEGLRSEKNSRSEIKVTDLRMSQAHIVDLAEAYQEENVAIFRTKQSIISIAFHTNSRREMNVQGDGAVSTETCRTGRLCRSLPDKPERSSSSNFLRLEGLSRSRSFGEFRQERDSGISHATSDGTSYANLPQHHEKATTVESQSSRFWNRIYSRRNVVHPVS